MPHRVHEILLVSSAYDAFILEEDGPLTDQLFSEYSELNLSQKPRITHVETAAEATQAVALRRFDLVITVVKVEDTDATELSRQIKALDKDIPIVLLTFDEGDLRHFPDGELPPTIDRVFLWTGDARAMIAAIKLVEDARNVDHDTSVSGVQVIVVVEDDLRTYSTFLALLYPELLRQSQTLIAEGVNELHRLIRMRARAKILLANDYEDAAGLLHRYRDNILALITDARFPKDGVETPDAGIELIRMVRQRWPDLPVLLHSSETANAAAADELRVKFVDKSSPSSPAEVRKFVTEYLGFGDFVFKLPDGTEVDRARDLYEMADVLGRVPGDSIAYHAARNHFSAWLKARSMFELAEHVRSRTLEDLQDGEGAREYLQRVIEEARYEEQDGFITDFSPHLTGADNRFVRLGKGSIGGKGRSIAFVNSLIVHHGLLERFDNLEIRIPKTIVIGTDEYDHFMGPRDAAELLKLDSDAQITERLLDGELSAPLVRDLWTAFHALKGPLAVRSSSLLEDSRFLPLAGVYATYMLPNNHEDPMHRFNELCRAIMAVYSSAYWSEAQTYLASTPHRHEEERMAVVIQQVVGQRHGDRFYPHLSGVAQSYDYYAIAPQAPEEGIAQIVLGMGEMAVGGGKVVRFCPSRPDARVQFADIRAALESSQREFYAVGLSSPTTDLLAGPDSSLGLHPLEAAERDGTLALAGSVYHAEDDVIRENLNVGGARLVTFNNVLRWGAVPLAQALEELLQVLRHGMGSEVEMEFALDMSSWGSEAPRGRRRKGPRMYVLQVRPMASARHVAPDLHLEALPADKVRCQTRRSLGDGLIENVRDIVYVRTNDVDGTMTPAIARDIRKLNASLSEQRRPYVLIGPGRWGTADPSLGVPVDWDDIGGARVIIERPIGSRFVEPSQGTHFFQNVVALRIGYLTVTPEAEGVLDEAWLEEQAIIREVGLARHARLSEPLLIHLDGRKGHAAMLQGVEPPRG